MKIILESPGAKISLHQGVIIIEKEKKKEKEKEVVEISLLHVTSIHIQSAVRISSELLIACIAAGIPVYFEDDLKISALLWSPSYGSIANIRKKQALFAFSIYKYKLIKGMIISKNETRISFLKQNSRQNKVINIAKEIEQINKQIKLASNEDQLIRSLEAHSSKKYFAAYNRLLPSKYRFEKRTYRKSRDLVNILLNYGYGILYNNITKALITAGLDPDLGFFHAAQYNKPGLSFDMIEPYRVWCEEQVLKTVKQPEINQLEHYLDDKGLLIKPVKHIFIEIFTEFLNNKKIRWHQRIKTPQTHIQLDAHQTAKYLLQFDNNTLIKSICR